MGTERTQRQAELILAMNFSRPSVRNRRHPGQPMYDDDDDDDDIDGSFLAYANTFVPLCGSRILS